MIRTLAGAERSSALQHAILVLVMPTHQRHFAPGDLQFLTSSTYHRAKLFESDRSGRRTPLCASRRKVLSPRFESNSPTTAPPAGWRLPARVLY
jgi:hypothetical protein